MVRTFYVTTGDIKEAVVAPSTQDAVRGALLRGYEKELVPGLLISCNTTGFGEHPDDDMMFVTENELKALHFSVKKFMQGFDLTPQDWLAYRKIKQAIEIFQDLLTDEDEL